MSVVNHSVKSKVKQYKSSGIGTQYICSHFPLTLIIGLTWDGGRGEGEGQEMGTPSDKVDM